MVVSMCCARRAATRRRTTRSADTAVHVADGHFTHDRRRGPTAIATRAAVVALAAHVTAVDAYPSGYTYTRTRSKRERLTDWPMTVVAAVHGGPRRVSGKYQRRVRRWPRSRANGSRKYKGVARGRDTRTSLTTAGRLLPLARQSTARRDRVR